MFDMHYDLLSRIYYDYLKFGVVCNSTKNDLKKIFSNNNVIGCFANLYFMSKDEMYMECGINTDDISVSDIFKKSISLLDDLISEGIISNNIKFIYSIEGCDYIKDTKELEELYNLGLRSILLVWNNKNKFGSGIRSEHGITDLGIEFINKAIDLGIIIDVSHCNNNTFYGVLDVVKCAKDNNKNVILIASHSNSKDLCSNERNLSYEQLICLRDIGGYIGIVSYNPFISSCNFVDSYLKHINYMHRIISFSLDRILVSTDNMEFLGNTDYCFDIHDVSKYFKLLSSVYNSFDVDKIMYKNALELCSKINKKE